MELDSILRLIMLVSSWGVEGLVFTLGFMNHSKVSSTRSESWEVAKGWRDRLTIWFANFPTSTLMHRGTSISIGNGGGQGTKLIVGSSYEIRGVSWFTRVGEAETSKGSNSP